MAQGKITIEDTNDMIEIVGKLTKEGVCFEAFKKDGNWIINITG